MLTNKHFKMEVGKVFEEKQPVALVVEGKVVREYTWDHSFEAAQREADELADEMGKSVAVLVEKRVLKIVSIHHGRI